MRYELFAGELGKISNWLKMTQDLSLETYLRDRPDLRRESSKMGLSRLRQNRHPLTLLTRMCYLYLCFSLAGRCPRTRKCQFHFFPSVLPQSGSVHLDCQSTIRT